MRDAIGDADRGPWSVSTVPNLVEQQIVASAGSAAAIKLAIGRVERVESRAPEGTILRQSPAPAYPEVPTD